LRAGYKRSFQSVSRSPRPRGLTAPGPLRLTPRMDSAAPVQGVTLERYAELLADVVDVLHDPALQAARVEARGTPRADWEAARAEWSARLQSRESGPELAPRFVALFVAALVARAQALAATQPAPAAPAAAAPPQQPGNIDQQVKQFGHELGQGITAGISAVGGFFDSLAKSVAPPAVGTNVLVAWSDGNRYPGRVVQQAPGQLLVQMTDGRQLWVPLQYISTG
jgi:hypothetical protein